MKYFEENLVVERFYDGDILTVGRENIYIDLYIHPTAREVRHSMDDYGVRLGFDLDLDLYCWRSSVMHYDISKKFDIEFMARLIFDKQNNTLEFSGYNVNQQTTDFINNNIDTILEKLHIAFSGRPITYIRSNKTEISFN